MNNERIAALTDAELSAALAEHVMGWNVGRDGGAPGEISYYDSQGELEECVAYWSPATSLDQVARCTEVMLAKGFTLTVNSPGIPGHKSKYVGRWWVILYRSCDELAAEMCATTEARAKAEACLLAKMKGGEPKSE